MEKNKIKKEKLGLVHEALQQILEERRQRGEGGGGGDDEELLSKLLSQLESLEKNNIDGAEMTGSLAVQQEESSALKQDDNEGGPNQVDTEEIARELRRIKRQNFITHCLLSVMIVFTALWKFQEVSMLLRAKDKLSHPVRSVGEFVKDALIADDTKPHVALPLLNKTVPELPHVPLPSLTSGNKKD